MGPAEALYSKFLQCTGVSTDSRTVSPGNIFFALSGPNFNGNQYAESAIEKGALVAVIDDEQFLRSGCMLVEDTLQALQDLAKEHRKNFKQPVVGITGSNGKTTTKELLKEVLAQKFNVQATQGNFNNHIGVPLTILKWTKETEIAIVEMGANHVGEIASYCDYTMPTHGLITNVGHAHTEGFGGIEGVLRGKSELFDSLRKSGGIPFINQNDERLKHMTKRFRNAVSFPGIDVRMGDSKDFVSIKLNEGTIQTKLTGAYNFHNASAAIAVGQHFGIAADQIATALENYKPQNHRSQIVRKGDLTIIVDAYNANPDSMKVALENLAGFEGKKIALLGDMNELENSEEEHLKLGACLNTLPIDQVILVGQKIRPVMDELPNATHFATTNELINSEALGALSNATILLKASRSIKLERLLKKL